VCVCVCVCVCVVLLHIRVTGGATKNRQSTRCTYWWHCVSHTVSHSFIDATAQIHLSDIHLVLRTSIEQNALMAVNRQQDTQPPPIPRTITLYPKRRHLIRKSPSLVPVVRQFNYNNDVSSYFFRTYLTLRLLMSYIYIYGAHILDVSRSHTTHHSR